MRALQVNVFGDPKAMRVSVVDERAPGHGETLSAKVSGIFR